MRAFMAVCVLALAACDPPLEEFFPPRFHSFDRDGIAYEVRAQYDPFERGWFTRVSSIERPLDADDLAFATALVETGMGPLVCAGNRLHVEPGEVWNPLAGDQVEFLDDLDTWHFVGRCTDEPAPVADNPWLTPGVPDVVVIVSPEG